MRNTFKAFLALALAAFAALAHADPPGRVGRLNYAAGAVSFAPAEAPGQWTQAVLNRPLTGGDRLWTDRDGRSELHVGSTAVRMAPLTSVDVLHLDDERMQLRLAQGTVNVRLRQVDPDEHFEIATPAGAVILREPGSYRIATDPDTTRIAVSFGRAELVTPAQTLTVPPGQVAVVPDGAPPAFEIAGHAPDDFDRWSAERDRREDSVASTRYVSRDMTGYEDLDQYGSWQTLPEYGAVWVPARVAPEWAPYRYGHWAWIAPWGWTWVDDAPWGFAPFHYGRWVRVHDYWAWAPGPIARRPVYAPALVAFVGGPRWSLSVTSGPAVGWFPLGWHEPYHPWYRASPAYVRNVNVTHVTNVTHVYNGRHAHRGRPDAVTVVSQQSFVSARPAGRSRVNVAPAELARAEVIRERAPAQPVRASLVPDRPGARPPDRESARERALAPTRAPEQREQRERASLPQRANEPERRAESERRAAHEQRVESERRAEHQQRAQSEKRESQRRAESERRAEPQRRPEPQRAAEPQPRAEVREPRRAEAQRDHRERAEQRPQRQQAPAPAARPAPTAAPAVTAPRPQVHAPRPESASRPHQAREQREGAGRPGAPRSPAS